MWVDSLLTIHILWSISLDQPFQEGAGEHRRQRREHSDPNLDVEGSEREGVLRERGGRESGSPDGNQFCQNFSKCCSFSAVSEPIFGSKYMYAFFSIF